MELKGDFLPQFKVRDTGFPLLRSTKHESPLVIALFTREPFARYDRWKHLEVHCNNNEKCIWHLACPKKEKEKEKEKLSELSFNRLQLTEEECARTQRREFGRYVARKALLDEEFWTAAWLRAESHWESMPYMRHIDSHKRNYAEAEFYALKKRCLEQQGRSPNCFCFIATKKEDKNARRTVLNSVVGTLDLSIKQFRLGETYPAKISQISAGQEPFDTRKYAYIANVCVAKFARRRGIASNMLYLAADVAKAAGMKQLFVHVNVDNKPAEDLYKKIGFNVVEDAIEGVNKLMSMEL